LEPPAHHWYDGATARIKGLSSRVKEETLRIVEDPYLVVQRVTPLAERAAKLFQKQGMAVYGTAATIALSTYFLADLPALLLERYIPTAPEASGRVLGPVAGLRRGPPSEDVPRQRTDERDDCVVGAQLTRGHGDDTECDCRQERPGGLLYGHGTNGPHGTSHRHHCVRRSFCQSCVAMRYPTTAAPATHAKR
jgi:hypothetical protein